MPFRSGGVNGFSGTTTDIRSIVFFAFILRSRLAGFDHTRRLKNQSGRVNASAYENQPWFCNVYLPMNPDDFRLAADDVGGFKTKGSA
jgi:hypothetical protein